ncbi:ParB N-terminal domain-containing protein [Pikeienuella piscinae]|uniref:ParB N-terminal domain-containing protein n=1 Tax=Pikeienuella piscinae TaxID=2748098 RepID=A0A7M3T6C4_9RHOB|nr:ParB N-terminal domain-containing protein [Pikeienuella piscinae]QIE57555.1 ParB N-terminal domain-containing protein [Pikeienuella piscinae]
MTEPAAPRLIPLDEIDPNSLVRDRIAIDEAAMEELVRSIAAEGLRAPVEVFTLAAPRPPQRYGLVSGFRRLAAFRQLQTRTENPEFDAIPAWLREAESDAELHMRMVAENDIRRDITPWEKSRIAVQAAAYGHFSNTEDAVTRLYPAAAPMKRSRIRAIVHAVEALDGFLAEPWRLSERQCLRIAAAACREDYTECMQTALEESDSKSFESHWRLLEPILVEAETPPRRGDPAPSPGRPRRTLRPKQGLVIRREETREGYCLHFTGRMARGGLIEDVLDEIERMFAAV